MEDTFKDLVEGTRCSVSPSIECYVVNLLCEFITAVHAHPRSVHLTELLRTGLQAEGDIRQEYLRVTGDTALFISGIFPDSFEALSRKTAYDLGYFVDVGRTAYAYIQTDLFGELADSFPLIVDMLNEISINIQLTRRDLRNYIRRRQQLDARTTRR